MQIGLWLLEPVCLFNMRSPQNMFVKYA